MVTETETETETDTEMERHREGKKEDRGRVEQQDDETGSDTTEGKEYDLWRQTGDHKAHR